MFGPQQNQEARLEEMHSEQWQQQQAGSGINLDSRQMPPLDQQPIPKPANGETDVERIARMCAAFPVAHAGELIVHYSEVQIGGGTN